MGAGFPLGYLQEFCSYWAESYRWRDREALLYHLASSHRKVSDVRRRR